MLILLIHLNMQIFTTAFIMYVFIERMEERGIYRTDKRIIDKRSKTSVMLPPSHNKIKISIVI